MSVSLQSMIAIETMYEKHAWEWLMTARLMGLMNVINTCFQNSTVSSLKCSPYK